MPARSSSAGCPRRASATSGLVSPSEEADYLWTPEALAGVSELEALARQTSTAMLCAERLYWRCHRRILADVLLVRGWQVIHLLEPGKAQAHTLTPWARITDGVVTYPALV